MHSLDKLDAFLNVPAGTSRAIIADRDHGSVPILNAALIVHGIVLASDTTVPAGHKPAWASLLRSAGVDRIWWMDGGPDCDGLPIEVI